MNNVKNIEPIVTDIKGVQAMLKLGRNKSMEIGKAAGAEIKISPRCMRYNVEKIKAYVYGLERKDVI